jgi:UDP-glucose 4,6-dehydratase
VCDKEFRFFESEADFLRQAVKTPRSHCVLDNSRALAAGLRLSHVADALKQALRDWRSTLESPETSAATTPPSAG